MPLITVKNGRLLRSIYGGGSYDGEKQMGDLNNWPTFYQDPNDFLTGTYDILSERSGTLYHTYGPVRGAINKQVIYAIGPGLFFRSQPDYQTLNRTKEWAVEWGKQFQKIVHYYFQDFNFYEKQSILMRTAMFGGDSLLFFDRKDGNLVDLVEASGQEIDCGYNDDKNYTLGIKHDSMLRGIAIRKHDGKDVTFKNSMGDQNVIQLYFKELSRQLRGFPLAYSIINLARNDDTHTDAITHRAVMEAIMFAVMKGSGTNLNSQATNLAKKGREAKGQDDNVFKRAYKAIKLGVGNIIQIKTDESLEFTDLKTPSNTFKDYKQWLLNYTAMCTGTPPEVITSMYSTSFTAHKGALNDFIKEYMKKRRTFERIVMDVVVLEIAKDAIQKGLIQAPGFFEGGRFIQRAYLQGMYLGPVPGHINPLVEVKADAEKVKNGFTLRSDIAQKEGHNNYDVFLEEWAQEQDKFTDNPQSYAEKLQSEIKEGAGNGENN